MGKKVLSIISFAAAFFAVQYGMDYYREYSAKNEVYKQIEEIRKAAKENSPDEPEVIAIQHAAMRKIEENINTQGSKKEKLQTAAGVFLGFYLVNHRQRDEYCKTKGVDIAPFTSAFKKSHEREYAIATKAISAGPSEVDKIYRMLKSQLATAVQQDIEFIASEHGVSLAEACRLISDNAATLVRDMHISVAHPSVYNILVPGA